VLTIAAVLFTLPRTAQAQDSDAPSPTQTSTGETPDAPFVTNSYCMGCHADPALEMTLPGGERLKLHVDVDRYLRTAHGKKGMPCAECHERDQEYPHPKVTATSPRALSRSIIEETCAKCHKEIYDQYKESVHGAALTDDSNLDVPSCTDCHDAHDVREAPTEPFRLDYPDTCSECHAEDMEKAHNEWLKNPPLSLRTFVGSHFDSVTCAACHSPGKRGIFLHVFDGQGAPLSEEDVAKHLGTDVAGLKGKIDTNSNGAIDAAELWDLFAALYEKGVWVTFDGKMDVGNSAEAHRVTPKAEATRDCETCHHPDSAYFQDVAIVMSKDATEVTAALPVESGVLQSVYSILPVRKFYAIGGTNIGLFDIVFYVAVLGGLAVPIGHVTLRVLTSPVRARRRARKGGRHGKGDHKE